MTFTADRYCKEVPYDSDNAAASLAHLRSTGANWVSIVVTWYQTHPVADRIFPIYRPFESVDPIRGFWNYTYISETPHATRVAVATAHRLGFKVILKPHIDITNDNGGGVWRGDIQGSPAWFAEYERYIVFWARVCELEKVEMLSMATELMGVTWNEAAWRAIIKSVRAVFHGQLTLAANWAQPGGGGELTNIRFWDALDYIGCDEYFPISDGTVESIVAQWAPLVQQFKGLHEQYGKPFILSEVGYCVGPNCQVDKKTPPGGEEEQASHYEGLLRVVAQNSEWFHGVFWWNWVSDDTFNLDGWGMCMDPKWKAAEGVLRRYYNATEPQPPKGNATRPACVCTL